MVPEPVLHSLWDRKMEKEAYWRRAKLKDRLLAIGYAHDAEEWLTSMHFPIRHHQFSFLQHPVVIPCPAKPAALHVTTDWR